ncbi:TPA: phage tail protein [Escherichia coli]
MSAGTLTLTNNSAAVAGSGTAFTTELAAGDFIVATVGGIPYTLPVKTVNSNTSATLVSNFTGPTQSGSAWSAVPRVALNMVTAALVAQSAEALRGLNYDKQNWQQLFSVNGNITVTLSDGSQFSGPSWPYMVSTVATKTDGAVPVNQGGTGAKTPADARSKLGLGSAATLDSGAGLNQVLTSTNDGTKSFGLGATYPPVNTNGQVATDPTGFYRQNNTTGSNFFGHWGAGIGIMYSAPTKFNIFVRQDGQIYFNRVSSGSEDWRAIAKTSLNTTVDSNGFLKTASPVVKIFSGGRYETNDESEGVKVTRLGIGQYLIEGCEALNSDAAWSGIDGGFDIPTDRNKQPLLWLDYEVNADGSVLVKTYHRTHPKAPAFARNELQGINDGDPVDIPGDQFVSVRVEMPVNSIWNQKQKDLQEEMEKAEFEREQTQQDVQ